MFLSESLGLLRHGDLVRIGNCTDMSIKCNDMGSGMSSLEGEILAPMEWKMVKALEFSNKILHFYCLAKMLE